MTEHTTQEATGGDELAELFVDVHEGDRLTLTYETPDGEERTVRAEASTNAKATELAREEPTSGNVAFWYRDLERTQSDTDSVPYAVVRYRPHGRDVPTVRLHGHTSEPETTLGIEYLGEVKRAERDDEDGEEGNFSFSKEDERWLGRMRQKYLGDEIKEILECRRQKRAKEESGGE